MSQWPGTYSGHLFCILLKRQVSLFSIITIDHLCIHFINHWQWNLHLDTWWILVCFLYKVFFILYNDYLDYVYKMTRMMKNSHLVVVMEVGAIVEAILWLLWQLECGEMVVGQIETCFDTSMWWWWWWKWGLSLWPSLAVMVFGISCLWPSR